MESPATFTEFIWWGFNCLWLIVVAMIGWIVNGIKTELQELRKDIRTEQRWGRWLVNVILAMRTRCAMIHPEIPMPEMPSQPEEE